MLIESDDQLRNIKRAEYNLARAGITFSAIDVVIEKGGITLDYRVWRLGGVEGAELQKDFVREMTIPWE